MPKISRGGWSGRVFFVNCYAFSCVFNFAMLKFNAMLISGFVTGPCARAVCLFEMLLNMILGLLPPIEFTMLCLVCCSEVVVLFAY